MSTPILHQLALLEGTPASVAEAEKRFGIGLGGLASFLVAIGYHDAKKAIQSGDSDQKAKGLQQMLALADACRGLKDYYLHLGLNLEAAQAAEIEGTAAAFAGDEPREKKLAIEWSERLTGEHEFPQIVTAMKVLEGDLATVGLKFLLKMAKYTELTFPERWGLVTLMASKKHPDTLGRALWACEVANSTNVELMCLDGLNANWELLNEAKPEQRQRFLARIAELEGAPKT